MEYEDVLIREAVGDGTIDPDDVCYVCEKRDCVCREDDELSRVEATTDYLDHHFPVGVFSSDTDRVLFPAVSEYPLQLIERGLEQEPYTHEEVAARRKEGAE